MVLHNIDYSEKKISIDNCRKFFGEAADTIRNSGIDDSFNLNFSSNNISDECISFFDVMARDPQCASKIVELNFELNRITNEGLQELKDLVALMPNLDRIYLAYNYLNGVGNQEQIKNTTFEYRKP